LSGSGQPAESNQQGSPQDPEKRGFFQRLLTLFMASSIAASYGTFASFAGRFLYPARPRKKGWLFVGELSRFKKGDSVSYRAPDGTKIAIARQKENGNADDFIALSSTCPHLGCQVHWEGQNNRFFCPCHNGVFDPQGIATAGPPADAKHDLPNFL